MEALTLNIPQVWYMFCDIEVHSYVILRVDCFKPFDEKMNCF